MTSPVFMHLPTSSVSKAWEAKREKRFRHITILSSQGLLVGSLSDRDLFRATLEIFTSPDQSGGDVQQMPIQQIMVRNVLSATPETEIRAIARILFEEHIEAMPIMMERDDLVGILT